MKNLFYIYFHFKADLIHLGAKYTPCMRRDAKIYEIIEEERNNEADTGCCIRNDNSGCVQTSRDKCSVSFVSIYVCIHI